MFFAAVLKLLVISAEELLFFDQPFRAKPPFKIFEPRMKPCSKDFEISMPVPEIFHPILRQRWRLAPHICQQISIGLVQKLSPGSANSKSRLKLCPPAVRYPKPPIDHEPRGVESLRSPLHLGDD